MKITMCSAPSSSGSPATGLFRSGCVAVYRGTTAGEGDATVSTIFTLECEVKPWVLVGMCAFDNASTIIPSSPARSAASTCSKSRAVSTMVIALASSTTILIAGVMSVGHWSNERRGHKTRGWNRNNHNDDVMITVQHNNRTTSCEVVVSVLSERAACELFSARRGRVEREDGPVKMSAEELVRALIAASGRACELAVVIRWAIESTLTQTFMFYFSHF